MTNNVQVLDVVGVACPMPIIKLKKTLSQLRAQADRPSLQVFFSDKGGLKDIPAFCQQAQLKCRTPQKDEKLLLSNLDEIAKGTGVYCFVITF